MVEKIPDLVAQQVKAIQNLKIDKITVWDSGQNGHNSSITAGFLRRLIGSLPPMYEFAEQVGVELPSIFGSVANGAVNGTPNRDDPTKRAKTLSASTEADAQ